MSLHYYPLINKLITRFRVQEKINNLYKFENEDAFSRPFITIAREPGSGGAPIAKEVAKKLGFECIDEQIVEEIAKSTRLRKEIIKSVDEKSRTRIEDMVHSMLNPEYIDDIKYVTELSKIILTYAHKGKVVLVGRGANFIAPFGKGLHVCVTAPYEVRVKRAMDHEGFDRDKAEEVIGSVEKERKNFVKQYLRKDPNKVNSYDLIINTTYFPMDLAADVIVESFYKKFPRTSRYVNLFRK
jgi:cytidylate kinase